MFELETPFISSSEIKMFERIIKRRLDLDKTRIPESAKSFIDACLVTRPEDR